MALRRDPGESRVVCNFCISLYADDASALSRSERLTICTHEEQFRAEMSVARELPSMEPLCSCRPVLKKIIQAQSRTGCHWEDSLGIAWPGLVHIGEAAACRHFPCRSPMPSGFVSWTHIGSQEESIVLHCDPVMCCNLLPARLPRRRHGPGLRSQFPPMKGNAQDCKTAHEGKRTYKEGDFQVPCT